MLISFLNYDFVNSLYPFELEVFAFNLSNSSQIYLQIHYLFSQLNLFSLEFLGLYFIELFVFFFLIHVGVHLCLKYILLIIRASFHN